MAVAPGTEIDASLMGASAASQAVASRRPIADAASRVAGAGALLGALGLGSALLVILRLFETWRVEPDHIAHQVSVLGIRLSYPTANAAAVVVLGQALLGLVVVGRAAISAARELSASRRFSVWLRSRVVGTLDDALVIKDRRPAAFCAGLLWPGIYVSSAAVAGLDEEALTAVLDHEREHRRRRDPLRIALGRTLVSALFFVPGVRGLCARHECLAELNADDYAAQASLTGREALARAMLAFADAPGAPVGAGIDPARADALLGQAPDWRFPAILCLTAAGVLTVLILVGVLAGRIAAGVATLDLPFLSAQPCVLVLAVIPAALGWAAWRLIRLRSTR
jgi:hypothetical protein